MIIRASEALALPSEREEVLAGLRPLVAGFPATYDGLLDTRSPSTSPTRCASHTSAAGATKQP